MAVHSGSWFGLPDFGITEYIGGLTGAPKTPQGGSNLLGKQKASTGTLGASTNTTNNGGSTYSAPIGPGLPQQTAGPYNSGGGDINAQFKAQTGGEIAPIGWQPSQQQSDPSAALRNEISSSWDRYLSDLGGTSGYLDEQRAAQEGIAKSQLDQGLNTVNTQKASSLKDIANTTRNAFQAGNNYLGSLGAGDSSAANQYSFAINQQANKQTGDLNNFVNTQIKDLTSQHDQQIQQIASWFAGKQQELKQMMAQGQLSKGQDLANLSKGLLDQAMQATNQIKTNSQNQYNALLEWASSNSQNMGQLQSNIAAIPQAMGQLSLGAGGVGSTPTYGGGGATNTKTDIFGRPIA